MVSAKKGALLRCDVPTKVFIVHMNSQAKAEGRKEFIISDLDEHTLLVNPVHVDEIRAAIKKYSDELTYDPTDKPIPGQQG
ncbi:RNA polymerase II transcription factor B subunit 5 [Tetrabaena socialis]|uniref:General transcription and DNA repair factor IIH subunit TFB5 n=1 Tax=Tetrabaena socialis TaxID=47790 RepID=A0A2J7ZWG7_9CHLO|nr:RNA polymerase II transcription factor B subunit 5 [Tetrabaena socialis]|eukprot:PNH04606.1 RNA polymerase II transcription factor B subunit 5 [Tetrabaena socialis]